MKGWILTWAAAAVTGTLLVAGAATSASSPDPGAAPQQPVSSKPVVSGFTVDIVAVRANPLDVEVDLNVIDGPTDGGLVFVPGPRLLAAGGIVLDLVSGRTNGNSMTLRFDRPPGLNLEAGDDLSLEMVSLIHRTVGFVGSQITPPAPVLVPARLDSAVNPSQIPAATSAALGPATVQIDVVALAPNQFRVYGRLNGLSDAEIAATTLSDTRLISSNGQELAPVAMRAGFGATNDLFEFTFDRNLEKHGQLHISLRLDTQSADSMPNLSRVLPYRLSPVTALIPLVLQ